MTPRVSIGYRDEPNTIRYFIHTYLLAVIDHKEVLQRRHEARKMQHMLERQQFDEFSQNKLKQACEHDDITGLVNGECEGAWKQRLMGDWGSASAV